MKRGSSVLPRVMWAEITVLHFSHRGLVARLETSRGRDSRKCSFHTTHGLGFRVPNFCKEDDDDESAETDKAGPCSKPHADVSYNLNSVRRVIP